MEKAKILGSSTLGSEQLASAATVETQTIPVENSNLEVSNNGAIQEATPTATNNSDGLENIATTEETPQEENAASFELNFEEPTEAQTTQQSSPQIDWKEILKNVDRNEAAKLLGFDDDDIAFADARKNGFEPEKYITSKLVDWNKVSDMDLIKSDFLAKHSHLTAEQQQFLFNKKYIVSDLDDDDAKFEKEINLKNEAHIIRQNKIAESQSVKIPTAKQPEKDEAYEAFKAHNEALKKQTEDYKNYLNNHEATKNLLQNKRVAIQIGKEGKSFNFNVDKPESINNALADGGKAWGKLMKTQSGEPDIAKQQLVILFAANPQKFIDDIYNFGETQGIKKKVSENANATRQIGNAPRNGAVNTTEKEVWKTNARSSTLGSN